LNNRIYVVAVQNKEITNIQAGDQLLYNTGIPANTLIGHNHLNDNINRLIPVSLEDSTQLTILRKKDTIQSTLFYTHRIESLYKIPHRKHTFENGICYYKLNNWESTEYFHFQNMILENNYIKKLKCIIFDLRNNGGGDEISAARIASCFITLPQPYCHYSYTYSNNLTIKESWVIAPNPVLNLSKIPVIVLTNRYTACSSESFIAFLKQYHSTTVISNDAHTSGTYNSPRSISILGDVHLRLPYIKQYVSNRSIIEKQGIEPDIYVHYKNIFDLAAFDDKIMQTAFQLARFINP
jgi:C-terminal processing protease CtpA/Prc